MTKNNIRILLDYLDEILPNASCELNYTKDYELVIAVMLSAQTTDASVNKVTSVLFSKYKTLDELYHASYDDVFNIIRPIGLTKNKTSNLLGIAKMLIENYDGKVPMNKNELQKLPGVGNKTAGVIRAEIFHLPELPVDTHILRISKRLKLAKKDDEPIDVERKLKKLIEESRQIKTHHQLIHFGRYYCMARSPKCEGCKLSTYCSKINL